MSSNSQEDSECLLTQTAQKICHQFVIEMEECTQELLGVGMDLECFAQEKPYGCRVVLKIYREQKLKNLTIIRLSSFVDIHYLQCFLNGQRDSLCESILKIVQSLE